MRPPLHLLGALFLASGVLAQPDSNGIDYATARFERRLEARRAAGPVSIDGLLSEADWSLAPVATHFVQNDPKEGAPATYETEVRFLYVYLDLRDETGVVKDRAFIVKYTQLLTF